MRRFSKFMRLSVRDRLLLLESLAALSAFKLGLWLLPFPTVRRFIRKHAQAKRVQADRATIRRVVWALNVISLYLPIFKNCLNRALAAQLLLGRRGQPADLRIGVARFEGGEFKAHAWVESEGRVVLGGGGEFSTFTPLPPLEGKGI
jgi:hypothetical protein